MNGQGSIWGVGLIIVLVALGLWWVSNSRTPQADELETLLAGLQQETELAFSDIQPIDFGWIYEGDDGHTESVAVAGKGFEAIGISSDQEQEIADYFEAQGFAADENNVAAGTVASLDGYIKEDIVVVIESNVTGGEAGLEAENVTYDVRVRAAKFQAPVATSDTRLLAEAFAAKYNKPVEDITVTVAKQLDAFVSGGVKLSRDAEATGGAFFAVKQNDQWVIAWDGNGSIPCANLDMHNFPSIIASECIDEHGDLKQR